MKTTDAKEKKQLKQLSDEELEKVNGGVRGWTFMFDRGVPEECNDKQYMCNHPQECNMSCSEVDRY